MTISQRAFLTAGVTAVLASSLLAGVGAAATKRPVHATFVGDSVAASISYTPRARSVLAHGLAVRLDLRVCRRLVTVGCPFQGATPSNALEAVTSLHRRLGKVLIVYVGYNESASGYRKGIDRIMRAALAQGAKGVVWVTLRETRDIYRETNAAIRAAAKHWPELYLADWNAFSAGKPWFSSDGLHMGPAGAEGLARFLRPFVFRAAAST